MTHKKKQAAIYVRVTLASQEGGSSVEAQAAACIEAAKSLAKSEED